MRGEERNDAEGFHSFTNHALNQLLDALSERLQGLHCLYTHNPIYMKVEKVSNFLSGEVLRIEAQRNVQRIAYFSVSTRVKEMQGIIRAAISLLS